MNKVEIGFSRWKVALVLSAFAYLAVSPLVLGFVLPSLFSSDGKTSSDFYMVVGFMGLSSIVGAMGFIFSLKKMVSNKLGVVLDEKGLWTNVSGWSEQFYAWSEIKSAQLYSHSSGSNMQIVTEPLATEKKSFLKKSSGFVLFYHLLDCNGRELAEQINSFVGEYKTQDGPTSAIAHNSEGPIQKAA